MVTTQHKKYEKQVLRFVEAELYAYPWMKAEIEALRADIIEATPERSVAVGQNLGDPTLAKTIRLITSKRLKRLTESYEAITRVLSTLSPEQKKFVEMKYWRREYTDYGIWQRLHISRRTFYNWREKILRAIAEEMGLL